MPKVIPMPGRVEKVVAERDQLSHGRLIHVVSVFPADGGVPSMVSHSWHPTASG